MSDGGDPTPAIRLFINYRREESAYPAGWLYDRLGQRFGVARVFKDVDSIALGDDFVEAIDRAVASCDVMIALIGEQWLAVADDSGRRRLDDPHDYVRLEIEAALARDVRIIPVLVDGARMPRAEELPGTLAPLVRRQALELTPSRFDTDAERLVRVLESPVGSPSATGSTANGQPPTAEETNRERTRRTRLIAVVIAGVGAVVVAVAVTVTVRNQGDGVVITGSPDTSRHGLELSDYRIVRERDPAGDERAIMTYSLTNTTETPIELIGTYVGVRNAADDNLDTEAINEGVVIDPDQTIDAGGQRVLDSTGLWLFWPCYALVSRETCPTEWQVEELLVE